MKLTSATLKQLIKESLNEVLKAQRVDDVDPKDYEPEERYQSFALMIEDLHTRFMETFEGDFDQKLSLISNAIVSSREGDAREDAEELEKQVGRRVDQDEIWHVYNKKEGVINV